MTATKPAGRPPLDGTTKTVYQVRLTAAQVATARALGDGNASAGIRAALTHADTAAVSAHPKP